MNYKLSISKILVGISIIFTLSAFIYPQVYILGMNKIFLEQGIYHIYLIQFFSSVFLHGSIFHFLFNSVFILYFGEQIETMIGKRNYLSFFLFTVAFVGVGISIFASGNTIGISGFCMAVLTFYTLRLKDLNNPEFKGGITAIILNVGIGLSPGISLEGHLFGVIAGIIFYYFLRDYRGRFITLNKGI